MDKKNIQQILEAIGNGMSSKYLYEAAVKVVNQARIPGLYDSFKSNWRGEEGEVYKNALKALKKFGWQEPQTWE